MINFTFRIQNWFWWQPWYSNGFINLPGKGVLEYRCYWKMPSIWVLWVLAGVVFMKRTQFTFLIQFLNVLNKSYFGWSSSFPFIWWQLTLFFAINANNPVPNPFSWARSSKNGFVPWFGYTCLFTDGTKGINAISCREWICFHKKILNLDTTLFNKPDFEIRVSWDVFSSNRHSRNCRYSHRESHLSWYHIITLISFWEPITLES